MTANLPMYVRPETVDAHNHYWALIKKNLAERNISAPEALSQPNDLAADWINPNLILSQTCGMPYRNTLHGKVQLAGTPDYRVPDCAPGYYRSAIIVRRSDEAKTLQSFENKTFALNSKNSQSGFSAAFWHFRPLGFWFTNIVASGGHQHSAQAVASGEADIAAIDAVTWRFLQRYESFTNELMVLDWTTPTPGLPYITSMTNDHSQVFESVQCAIESLPEDVQDELGIYALIDISADVYLKIDNPPIS